MNWYPAVIWIDIVHAIVVVAMLVFSFLYNLHFRYFARGLFGLLLVFVTLPSAADALTTTTSSELFRQPEAFAAVCLCGASVLYAAGNTYGFMMALWYE